MRPQPELCDDESEEEERRRRRRRRRKEDVEKCEAEHLEDDKMTFKSKCSAL